MHCPNCGNPIEDDDLFCGECGHKISRHPQSVRNAESEITKAEKNDEEQNITSNNKDNNAILPPKLYDSANIKITEIIKIANETLLINTQSDNTFLNAIGCLTTKRVSPNIAPTMTTKNRIIPKMILVTKLPLVVPKIPISTGITEASKIANTIKPIINNDNNNLKLKT